MKTLELVQGSPEWNAVRAKHFTASEAPIMMGASKLATRNDLLRMKATGDEREYSRWVEEVLFANGHAIEAAVRPTAEAIIGEDLYPVTATDDDGSLLASFDGITMLETVCWEAKQWNKSKAAIVREGRVPDEDYWQCIQQLVISRADKLLYMVSDGTEERTVYTWLTLTAKDEKALRAGWKQFAEDLEAYEPQETPAEVVGRSPDALPTLRIELTGMVKESNLSAFKEHALAVVQGVNRDLQTDEDFANAEKTVKWCAEVEGKLDTAKQHALAQTADIDELFRAVDSIKAEFRATRLELDKLVKGRKEAIRDEILQKGKDAYKAHLLTLNESLGSEQLLTVENGRAPAPDFAGVMKGKKTVKSLRDAVDGELARVKLASNEVAEQARANLKTLEKLIGDAPRHLIQDWRELVFKDAEALEAIVKNRIAEHEAEQKAERERIERETEERLRREQEEAKPAPQPDPQPAPPAPHEAAVPQGAHTSSPGAAFTGEGPRNALMDDLEFWRRNAGLSQAHFDALLKILDRHGIRGAA